VKFIQNSPVYYLDQIEAQVLIAHGSEDNAVASFLGDEVFVGLRRLGKRAEYAKYEGEGHVPRHWSYANQYDLASRVLRWLETYLKN
jgi:dipeptidyl aminopeptidase/acylaminoacyl peptidase